MFDPATLDRKKSKHQVWGSIWAFSRSAELECKVSFPDQIDMAPFLAKPSTSTENAPQLYRLSGVLLHKGASAYHGHYETEIDLGYVYKIIRWMFVFTFYDSQSQWFSFNDETVTRMKNPFIIKKKGDESSKA
jgi:hypothetical protein